MEEKTDLTETIQKLEKIYSGSYMDVEKQFLRLPDGREAVREIVHVRNAVAVLPILSSGDVVLVRQYRPAIQKTILEIPAGLLDDGEDEESAAKRECEEETGYRPKKLQRLLHYAHAEGYSTGWITLFVATDFEQTGQISLDNTEHLEPVQMSFTELQNLVLQNEIVDSKTILSAILAEKWLGL
ncbi:NUDIX hydrolase [candidate division KSB1 bacterium]|nr:NUDIX hydrolase [candidate division KSB1 bacterium]